MSVLFPYRGQACAHLYARRQRTLGAEEKRRGQRLFGNLMGTLAKFGKEEKTRNSTEKVRLTGFGVCSIAAETPLVGKEEGRARQQGRAQDPVRVGSRARDYELDAGDQGVPDGD